MAGKGKKKTEFLPAHLATKAFDDFTKAQYDEYVKMKLDRQSLLDDTDPVAWFTLDENKLCVIDLANRCVFYFFLIGYVLY